MTIDTSTTAGKIAVMQASERGETVQCRPRSNVEHRWCEIVKTPGWDWKDTEYRIKPREPREFTLVVSPSGGFDYPMRGHNHHLTNYESGYKLIKVREVIE